MVFNRGKKKKKIKTDAKHKFFLGEGNAEYIFKSMASRLAAEKKVGKTNIKIQRLCLKKREKKGSSNLKIIE